jgi:hypothetical protein
VLNNPQDIVLTLGKTTSMANIVAQGVTMKEKPNAICHESKFYILITESSFIDLCDYFDEDKHSFFYVVVLVFVNSRVVEK